MTTTSRAANYTGSLADALAPMIDVGASAAFTSQPLAAARQTNMTGPCFLFTADRLTVRT